MIPSPFTAELARQHRADLAAARTARGRRPRLAAAVAAPDAAVRRVASRLVAREIGPAACPTC